MCKMSIPLFLSRDFRLVNETLASTARQHFIRSSVLERPNFGKETPEKPCLSSLNKTGKQEDQPSEKESSFCSTAVSSAM